MDLQSTPAAPQLISRAPECSPDCSPECSPDCSPEFSPACSPECSPEQQSVPQTAFRGTSRQFSETMLLSGMYRDHGFNTSMDRSRVTVSPGTQHKRTSLHHLCHHGNQSSGSDGNQ
uniref:Uncharacterized protein n=1 Tax=Amphiprion ocellaris TaxID=80972 RepID=A0AAQ5XN48_AMPOC